MAFATARQLFAPIPIKESRYHVTGRIQSYPMRSTRFRIRALPPPNFYLGDSDSLGTLDFSLKKAFKSVTKAVRKVGRVVLRVVPGAVAGFVASGFNPIGAIVGGAAGYESARRAGGHGISLKGSQLVKSVAFGAGAGLATAAVGGALVKAGYTSVAPAFNLSYATTGGVLTSISGGTPLATLMAQTGAGAVGTIGTIGRTLLPTVGALFASKPVAPQVQEQLSQETSWVELPASAYQAYQNLYRPITGAQPQPQPSYLTDAYAQSGGGEPTSVPASPGYVSPGFAPSEEQVGAIQQAGLFSIPWTYIGLGVTGVMIIYLLSQPSNLKAAYSRNPRRRRRRR